METADTVQGSLQGTEMPEPQVLRRGLEQPLEGRGGSHAVTGQEVAVALSRQGIPLPACLPQHASPRFGPRVTAEPVIRSVGLPLSPIPCPLHTLGLSIEVCVHGKNPEVLS